jgi:hypothetical protein
MEQIDPVRFLREQVGQRTMERVLDLVVQSLDVNELLRQVDVDALLSRVDVDALLAHIDVDALLRHVDVDAVVEKVDVNALVSRVDVQALVERIDIDALVQHTDIGAVMVMSSGHVTSKAVDTIRAQAIELDGVVDRWVRRLLHRRRGPAAPRTLLGTEAGP